MAVRRATRHYETVIEFLEDHAGSLSQGAVLLPPGAIDGEPAPELKLDMVVPPLGRLGPIAAQVVHRGTDGSVALRIPEWPASVEERITELLDSVELIRAWLIEQEGLVAAGSDAAASSPPPEADGAPAPAGQGRRRSRGFPVPDLRAVAPDAQGSRALAELRPVLIRMASDKATGLMTFKRPDGQIRYGFWSQGGPVGFRTEPLDESEVLGVLLYKAGQIDKEQLRESLEIMKRDHCRQGEAFMQQGIMSFPQLVMVLGKQAEFQFQRTLAETQGTWTFHALDKLPERFLPTPLKVPAMLFRALFQKAREMKSDTLYTSLKDYLDKYIYLPAASRSLLPDMRLSAPEQRFVETIDVNSWRVRELYSVSPLSRAITAAVLRALIDLDFFEFRTEQSDARAHAQLQTIIDRKKEQMFKGSFFDLLEVHWICLSDEVETAYERLKNEFRPGRFRGMDAAALSDVATINEQLEAAHATLADDRRRREYRKSVIEEGKIVQSAELLAKQGDMALMRHDRQHATMCFAKATELVPQRPEFRASLARARAMR